MALQKASPADLRKAIEMANHFVKNGINFVPVPICGDGDEVLAIDMLTTNLNKMEKLAELEK